MIEGIGKDVEITENEKGGKQSNTPYSFNLLDAKSMFELAKVLKIGAEKYEPNNWRKISCNDHINHALQHIFGHMAGDTQDDHLEHAFCRLMMAVATKESD